MVIIMFALTDQSLMPSSGYGRVQFPTVLFDRKKSWLYSKFVYIFPLHAVLSVLYQKKVLADHEILEIRHVGKFSNHLYSLHCH